MRVSDLVGSDIRWLWSGLVGEKAAGGVVLIRIQKTNHLLRQVLSQQAIYKRIRTTLPSPETSSFSWSNMVGPQIKSIVKEEQAVSISQFLSRFILCQASDVARLSGAYLINFYQAQLVVFLKKIAIYHIYPTSASTSTSKYQAEWILF